VDLSFAWEVTVDDVLIGLERKRINVTWEQADKIHDMIDLDEMEEAALRGDDMDEQTELALEEFYNQIFEDGQLKPEIRAVLGLGEAIKLSPLEQAIDDQIRDLRV
jgi:hypothetical protein